VSQKNLYLLQSLLIFRQQQDTTTSVKTNSDHNEDEQHEEKTYSGKTNPLFAACIRGWHEGIDCY